MSQKKKAYQPYLEGKRIYLREVRPCDVNDDYYRWLNDPEVGRYLETRFKPNSPDRIAAYVREVEEKSDQVFMAIIVKRGKQHIGNIKIGPINWYHRLSDVSILIGEKDYWGKGYGTEAIQLIVGYAFNVLNLHKLSAGAYAGNIGSIRAFEKANFLREGLRKKHRFQEGAYVDEVLLGIVRRESA